MLKILQWPLEETRTPGKSCHYVAECSIEGQCYSAKSRYGAPNELARLLISAGIPDQPAEVSQRGIPGFIRYRSLHDMARWMYVETASMPLRRERWRDMAQEMKAWRERIAEAAA